jgi:hypothetical protein
MTALALLVLSIVYIKSMRSTVVTDGTCSPSLSLTMLYTTNKFNKLRRCVWTVQSNYTIDHNTLEFPKHNSARWLQLLQGQLILMRMVSCTTILWPTSVLWQYIHFSSLIYISCIDEDMLMLGNPYWLTCCLGDAKQTREMVNIWLLKLSDTWSVYQHISCYMINRIL